MNKVARGTPVEVTWMDTESVPHWTDLDKIDQAEPPVVKTVGYYYGCKRKGKIVKWIVLNHSIHEGQQADYTIIPFGCVCKMERIE
jgi:hypothetical protein